MSMRQALLLLCIHVVSLQSPKASPAAHAMCSVNNVTVPHYPRRSCRARRRSGALSAQSIPLAGWLTDH